MGEKLDLQQVASLKQEFHRGFVKTCGITLVSLERGRAESRLEISAAHSQQDGFVHAGVMATMAHSLIASLTGHPAVVLPLALSGEGLPIGVQVTGRRWEDMALLNVAEALTEITGPFRRPPGY